VHLRTVLAYLQEHRQREGRTFTDLRAHLARLAIPVDRGVNVAGTPAWGVRRRYRPRSPFPGRAAGSVYRAVYRRLTCTSTDSSTSIYRPVYSAISPGAITATQPNEPQLRHESDTSPLRHARGRA
jgi:hypothetical protein